MSLLHCGLMKGKLNAGEFFIIVRIPFKSDKPWQSREQPQFLWHKEKQNQVQCRFFGHEAQRVRFLEFPSFHVPLQLLPQTWRPCAEALLTRHSQCFISPPLSLFVSSLSHNLCEHGKQERETEKGTKCLFLGTACWYWDWGSLSHLPLLWFFGP